MAPLTFVDLLAVLKGEVPPPDSRALVFSLPLSHRQLKELTPLLQENQWLRSLKLRGCRLDNDAANELSRGVAFNVALRTLDLRDNEIGGVGANYLANALRTHNFTLLSLDLSGNPALVEDPEAMQQIAMSLHRNSQNRADSAPPSPTSNSRALVRIQEVPPETPAGRTRLSLSDGEMERRFQELERAQEAHRAELASVAEAGAELAQYRATLDLASQQMAMVLELLRGDVEGLKARLDGQPQGDAVPSNTAVRLEQRCSEMQEALVRLQERVDGGSQQAAAQQEISLLMDAVQLLEAKLARLEADGSASVAAQQEQGVQELKQQVALATEAANKAGGEADAVASSMKAVGASIKALQGELAANTASFMSTQRQAAGAAEGVAALEQQMRTLQLSLDAMEQALDGADVGQQLAQLQERVAALTTVQAAAAAAMQQAERLGASLAAVEEQQGEVAAQVQALDAADLPDRAARLEGMVAKLEAAAGEQAAAVSQLAPASAVETLRQSSASALQEAVGQLSAAQAEHTAAVAAQLAALPAPYDDGALQARVAAAEAALQQTQEALAALRTEELDQLKDEVQAQLQAMAEQQAAAVGQAATQAADGLAELCQSTLSRHAALEAAVEEQQAHAAERLAALEEALAAAPPATYDDGPLRSVVVETVAAARAEMKLAMALLVPRKDVEQLHEEGEAQRAALAERLAALGVELAAVKAGQAAAEGRTAAAEALEQVREAADERLAELAAQVAALEEAQAASAALAPVAVADVEQLRLVAQQAAAGVEELRGTFGGQVAALVEQVAAAQQQAEQARGGVEDRLAAAQDDAQLAARRLAALEADSGALASVGAVVPAAALAEVQQECEQARVSTQQLAAAVEGGLAELRADLEQHRAAVLGQCTELQEGLEAVPEYEGRLAAVEAGLSHATERLASSATAADLHATAAQLHDALEAGRAAAAEQASALKAAAEVQQEQLAALQAGAALAAEQLSGAATAEAVRQLQQATEARQAEVAEQLAELGGALKAAKVSMAAQHNQISALEAAVGERAPAEAVSKLRGAVEAQHMVVAKQLGELLSSLQAATDGHREELEGARASVQAAESSAADALAALRHAVQQAQQEAAQGITSAAAAVLCQEAVRPVEERLAAVQRQQGEAAAGNSEALAHLQQALEGLQDGLTAFRQASTEHSVLADTVGEMRGSALAVAAAVAGRSPQVLPSPLPPPIGGLPWTASPVPSLPLGMVRHTDAPASSDIASFPLTDRTLYKDCESEGEDEEGQWTTAAAPPEAHMLHRQHIRLEGVLEAELLCLKQLLMGGSPLVAGRMGAVALTPAGQRFFDAESVLGDPSPATASRPWRLAATPAGSSAAWAAVAGSKLAAAAAVADASGPLASLETQFHSAAAGPRPGSAGFGGDITNTNKGAAQCAGAAANKPAAPPAANPAGIIVG